MHLHLLFVRTVACLSGSLSYVSTLVASIDAGNVCNTVFQHLARLLFSVLVIGMCDVKRAE